MQRVRKPRGWKSNDFIEQRCERLYFWIYFSVSHWLWVIGTDFIILLTCSEVSEKKPNCVTLISNFWLISKVWAGGVAPRALIRACRLLPSGWRCAVVNHLYELIARQITSTHQHASIITFVIHLGTEVRTAQTWEACCSSSPNTMDRKALL